MSRLIDADDLIEYIKIWEIGNSISSDQKEFIDCVNRQLTVFDVDKVISELKRDTVAFSYVRTCNSREMFSFYCELDNGMLYMKEFMTYASLHLKEHKKKAIKKFMEQDEFKYFNPRQIQYVPELKNMYRIKTKYDWDYSEANHSYATG